mmetsp:Transcript_78027/g.187074  ORF Transcript_78027/g.187074 Transcript_78027/m.187074 type:complete len:270 (-) Transcript_78027:623-1432(-)
MAGCQPGPRRNYSVSSTPGKRQASNTFSFNLSELHVVLPEDLPENLGIGVLHIKLRDCEVDLSVEPAQPLSHQCRHEELRNVVGITPKGSAPPCAQDDGGGLWLLQERRQKDRLHGIQHELFVVQLGWLGELHVRRSGRHQGDSGLLLVREQLKAHLLTGARNGYTRGPQHIGVLGRGVRLVAGAGAIRVEALPLGVEERRVERGHPAAKVLLLSDSSILVASAHVLAIGEVQPDHLALRIAPREPHQCICSGHLGEGDLGVSAHSADS